MRIRHIQRFWNAGNDSDQCDSVIADRSTFMKSAIMINPGTRLLVDQRSHPWSPATFFYLSGLLACLSAVAIYFDVGLTRFANTEDLPGDLRRIIELSEIFAHGFGVAIACMLIWSLAPSLRRRIPRLICCALLPGMLVLPVKLLVVRRRPAFFYPQFADYVDDTWIGGISDWTLNTAYLTQSFPSAHTATAFGLGIALGWMLPRARFIFFGLALLASFQRIEAGAHWLSDVFAGASIALLVCGFLFQRWGIGHLFDRIERRSNSNLPGETEPEGQDRQVA